MSALTATLDRLQTEVRAKRARRAKGAVPTPEALVSEAGRRLGVDWRDADDADRLRLLHAVRLLSRAWLRREAERACQALYPAEVAKALSGPVVSGWPVAAWVDGERVEAYLQRECPSGYLSAKALFGDARKAATRFFDRAGRFIRSSVLAGWLAVAGPGEPSAAALDALDRGVTEQHEYLANFKQEVLEERKRLVPARAELYGGSVWMTAQNARLAEQVARETPFGRRVHRNADEPCEVCAAAIALGWVTLDRLPPLGDCLGLNACHCDYEFTNTLPKKAWGGDGASLTTIARPRRLIKTYGLPALDPALTDADFLDAILKRFNPTQSRDSHGRWTSGAGVVGSHPAARRANRHAAGKHKRRSRKPARNRAHQSTRRLLADDRTRVGRRMRDQRRLAEAERRQDVQTLHDHRAGARRKLAERHAAERAAVRGGRRGPVKRHERERQSLERRYDRMERQLAKTHEMQRRRERTGHRTEAARLREDHERHEAERRSKPKPQPTPESAKPPQPENAKPPLEAARLRQRAESAAAAKRDRDFAAKLKDHPDLVAPGHIKDRIAAYHVGDAKHAAILNVCERFAQEERDIARRRDVLSAEAAPILDASYRAESWLNITSPRARNYRQRKADYDTAMSHVAEVRTKIEAERQKLASIRERRADAIADAIKTDRPARVVMKDVDPGTKSVDGLELKALEGGAKASADRAKAWLEKVVARGDDVVLGTRIGAADDQRAYHTWGHIAIGTADRPDVVIHEFGHAIEDRHVTGGTQPIDRSLEFLRHRVGNEQPVSMRDTFGDRFKPGERGREDKFREVFEDESSAYYAGKDYGTSGTEILSMGMQQLYNNPMRLAKDKEYCKYVLGMLDGSLR